MKEFIKMSTLELEKECLKKKKELSSLKMQVMMGEYKKSSDIRKIRRDIARMKAAIHFRKEESSEQ